MGDRSYVSLILLKDDLPRVQAILKAGGEWESNGEWDTKIGFVELSWDEVRGGDLPFLDELALQGIPFDSNWDAGHDYGPGTDSCRYTPEGEIERKAIYDSQINPELRDLLRLLNADGDALTRYRELRKYLLDHDAAVTTLPWDNQAQYAKLQRAKVLIGADIPLTEQDAA